MAESADAADLKSADSNRSWGFKSPSGHHERVKMLMQKGFAVRDCEAQRLFLGHRPTRCRGHILN